MKNPLLKPNRVRKPLNITLPDEVREALAARAEAFGVSQSKILGALAKVYCALPVDPSEAAIEGELKKAMGRAQFLAFLDVVGTTLISIDEKAFTPLNLRPNFSPEAWSFGDVGILAFYSPTAENIGDLFSKVMKLRHEHGIGRVIVVTVNGNMINESTRASLEAAQICMVSMPDLRAALGKLTPTKKPRR